MEDWRVELINKGDEDECGMVKVSWLIDFISSIEQRVREQETEKIRTAFIKNFSGAGELWFPYESPGHCTKEEADEAAQEAWDEVMEILSQKDKTT